MPTCTHYSLSKKFWYFIADYESSWIWRLQPGPGRLSRQIINWRMQINSQSYTYTYTFTGPRIVTSLYTKSNFALSGIIDVRESVRLTINLIVYYSSSRLVPVAAICFLLYLIWVRSDIWLLRVRVSTKLKCFFFYMIPLISLIFIRTGKLTHCHGSINIVFLIFTTKMWRPLGGWIGFCIKRDRMGTVAPHFGKMDHTCTSFDLLIYKLCCLV